MIRKLLMVCAAVAMVSTVSAPTSAWARGGHGHGGGHWRGGGWGWGGPRFYGFYGVYPYAYPYYGCWRNVRVWTPYGPRWRRVWVCG
jgi:hypothetical protein